MDKLEELYLAADGDDAALAKKLIEFWKTDQPSAVANSPSQLTKLLAAIDNSQTEAVDLKIRHLIEDDERRNQIASWGNLIRRDLRGIPFVIPEGGLVVQETKSRANAGAHYTPRSLAEEVVLHALQPLCYEPGPLQTADSNVWKLKNSTEILNLRIADIAVGSGAFLVAAARYLGERLLEAWQQESAASGDTTGRDLNLAIREVVSQCLYGADINEMAVEMCKLSLWLVSLDPKKPFSFVDDKVLHGNSLLGLTDVKQLRGLHINPSARRLGNPGFTVDVDTPLRKAADIRAKLATPIADQAELDPQRSAKHKKALLAESNAVTGHLRKIADGVIAAGLKLGGKSGKPLEEAYENLSFALLKAYPNSAADADSGMLGSIIASGLQPTVETDYARWKPLHWIVEVPDVMIGHGGFDAIIGNPPFLGGQKLSGTMGDNFRDWLVNIQAGGRRGSADLVAYFFLRAVELLNPSSGQFGLIATNTVAQGDTQEVGLARIVNTGATIRRAIPSAPWPSKAAVLEYAAVWASLPPLGSEAQSTIFDRVGRINSMLAIEGRVSGPPKQLQANAEMAFVGTYIFGPGFVLTRDEAMMMLELDPRNSEVIFPYLGGEDLNSKPDFRASRWVINFFDWTEEKASQYTAPFQRVHDLVRPQRLAQKQQGRKDRWWQFAARAANLAEATRGLQEILAVTRVSKTVMPVRVATDLEGVPLVVSESINVFASDSYGLQAVLSSQLHQLWVVEYASSLRADTRYTASDVFETFPIPLSIETLAGIGRDFENTRSKIMLRRELGLTKLYNLVNDPAVCEDVDIDALREVHCKLDDAVLAAYGWDDLDTTHGFHAYKNVVRWTFCPQTRQEILDRLLEENHRRARLEVANGPFGNSKRIPGPRPGSQLVDAQEKMF